MQIRRISLRAPITAPKIRRRPALPTRTHFEHWTKPEHTRGPSLTDCHLGVATLATSVAGTRPTPRRLSSRSRALTAPRAPSTSFPTGTRFLESDDIDSGCSFYLGKKIAYVSRAQKEIRGTKIRVIWGKVTRPHGMFRMEREGNGSLSRAATLTLDQATLASSAPSSTTPSPRDLSALRFASCSTPLRYK